MLVDRKIRDNFPSKWDDFVEVFEFGVSFDEKN
jgi:polyribonucleotide nucleotidyltransferase